MPIPISTQYLLKRIDGLIDKTKNFMKLNKFNSIDFNQRNRDRWIESIAKKLPPKTKVLDIGAGTCPYRKFFRHCNYVTHDFRKYKKVHRELSEYIWKYGKIDIVSDITSIPVADASFDVIICTEVLEHVPEPIKALQEISRILRVRGKLFLSSPLGSGIHQQPHHFYGGFTPYFYRKYLKQFGFRVINIKPNGGFFLHLLQEIHRAAWIIKSRRKDIGWNIQDFIGLVSLFILTKCIPTWLIKLNKEIFIKEFTVGYFVEAQKVEK